MTPSRRRFAAASALAALLLAGCAGPAGLQLPDLYSASMDGAQEVPPVATAGSGLAKVEVDARGNMRWTVDHERLSGPVTGAHVHGPAGPGQNGPVLIPLAVGPAASSSGQVHLTPEQVTQLGSGQWYVNLHTERHPAGEIRGQLRPRR